MKNILVLVLLVAFSFSAVGKDKYPKLAEIKDLAGINKIELNSTFTKSIDQNLEKLNSGNDLNPLALNNNADKNATTPKRFNFSIMPYAWFTAVGGTVGYDSVGNKYGFNESFSDAVKYLKMAAAASGKIKYDRVSFVFDIAYFNLKGFGTEVKNENAPDYYSANWTVKQTLYDLFLAYLFPGTKKTMVDIYGGGRLFVLNTATTLIDNPNGNQRMSAYDNSFLDPVIGVNAEYVLDSKYKWIAWTKGDIGGFGVNSQMTWQLNAGAGYMLAPEVPLTLGFKYVGVNHDKNRFNWTVNEYGFTLGIGYRY
ncbi:MAG: hypothetical protein KDD00_16530 [Ignavibacteriae bacterium]|nr:hypothetical protein [Ignavibacteriota bacterium]